MFILRLIRDLFIVLFTMVAVFFEIPAKLVNFTKNKGWKAESINNNTDLRG